MIYCLLTKTNLIFIYRLKDNSLAEKELGNAPSQFKNFVDRTVAFELDKDIDYDYFKI